MNKIKANLRKLEGLAFNTPEPTASLVEPTLPVPSPSSDRLITISQERIGQIRNIWGHYILAEPDKVAAISRAQDEITEESGKVLHAAINMGRSLLDVKRVLTPAEFARGLRQSPKAWRGLSRGNVNKLMSVALWWDGGRLPQDRAPQTYTVLYEFTTLGEAEFAAAMERGVFRPDVSRVEVISFKKSLRRTIEGEGAEMDDTDPYDKLVERRHQLLVELVAVRREMRALRN